MTSNVAIVTGAGQGLGRAVAAELIRHGYRVALFGRNIEKLKIAAAALGQSAVPFSVDVGKADAVRTAFKAVEASLGTPVVLVNNAATFNPFVFDEADDAAFETAINTNLMGPIHCMREAMRRMRTAGHGHIVNVSSDSVLRPYPMLSVYAATKMGLETITAALREEYREIGIRMTVFRAGRMLSEGAAAVEMPPELASRFYDAVVKHGLQRFSGAGMRTETAAMALVNTILTPSDAHVDLVSFRSA